MFVSLDRAHDDMIRHAETNFRDTREDFVDKRLRRRGYWWGSTMQSRSGQDCDQDSPGTGARGRKDGSTNRGVDV